MSELAHWPEEWTPAGRQRAIDEAKARERVTSLSSMEALGVAAFVQQPAGAPCHVPALHAAVASHASTMTATPSHDPLAADITAVCLESCEIHAYRM